MGFSGAEILMVRGEPSMLLTKLEKPLFLRMAPGGLEYWASPENLLGLKVPLSDLGGVTSIIGWPPGGIGAKIRVWGKRRSGLVWVWFKGGGGGGRAGCAEGVAFVDVDCIEDKIPETSNGAPTRS